MTSAIPPSVNHYLSYRVVTNSKGRPMAVSYKTKEAKTYQSDFADYVRREVAAQGWERSENDRQHYYADAVFYFDKTNMDCNNYFKVLLDAITDTGLVWPDDNVVCERVQRIYYDNENPRVELTISPADYIGIFNDVPQMERFVSRCFGCTRYKRNCSVLRNARECRVQDGVTPELCSFYKQRKDYIE